MFNAFTLTLFGWAVCYPLVFVDHYRIPLSKELIKAQIYFVNLLSGIALIMILLTDIDWWYKLLAIIWKTVLIAFSRWQWLKKSVTKITVLITTFLGISVAGEMIRNCPIEQSWLVIVIIIIQGVLLSYGTLALYHGYRMLKGRENNDTIICERLNKFKEILLVRVCFGAAMLVFGCLYGELPGSCFTKADSLLQQRWLLLIIVNGMIFPLTILVFLRDSIKTKAYDTTMAFILGMFFCVFGADLQVKYLMINDLIIM